MTHKKDHPPPTNPANAKPGKVNECATCGHNRIDHIREEGACRPGYVCPAKCEEFASTDMVTINPAEALPHEVYEGAADGERWTMQRVDVDAPYQWHSTRFDPTHEYGVAVEWHSDAHVSSLVRLVPARPVTRDDLPDMYAVYSKVMRSDCGDLTPSDLVPVLDAVVARLNANGGLPASSGVLSSAADCVLESAERVKAAEYEGQRLFDQCRARYRERDEAKRERDGWKARAEAAEARTTPTVTRDEVSKVVHGVFSTWYDNEDMVDAVCALFGVEAEPADPAEPEGDVIVRDAHDRMWWVTDDGWTNGTSRLDHDWVDVPKPIRVTYRAESEAKR